MIDENDLQNFIQEDLNDKKFKTILKKYKSEIESNNLYIFPFFERINFLWKKKCYANI